MRAERAGWGTAKGGGGDRGTREAGGTVVLDEGGDIIACKEAVCKGHRCRAEGVIFHFLWEGGKERIAVSSIPFSILEW